MGMKDEETDWILNVLFFGTLQAIFKIFLNVPTCLLSNHHSTPQTLPSKIYAFILPLSLSCSSAYGFIKILVQPWLLLPVVQHLAKQHCWFIR